MITCEELLSPLSPAGGVLSDHHNVRIVVKFANHLGEAALGHSYLDRLRHNLALPHGIDKFAFRVRSNRRNWQTRLDATALRQCDRREAAALYQFALTLAEFVIPRRTNLP
jgi:hypothetical protein